MALLAEGRSLALPDYEHGPSGEGRSYLLAEGRSQLTAWLNLPPGERDAPRAQRLVSFTLVVFRAVMTSYFSFVRTLS